MTLERTKLQSVATRREEFEACRPWLESNGYGSIVTNVTKDLFLGRGLGLSHYKPAATLGAMATHLILFVALATERF